MYSQQIREDFLYMMLYGAAAMLSLAACCYLLLRRSNAIAPDVTSPLHLRRWTAAFFASLTLSHVWYLPTFYLTSAEDILLSNAIGAILDFLTAIPFAIIVLLSMLQDRRRPLWPVFLMMAPLIIGLSVCGISHNNTILPLLYAYYLLIGIALLAYMVRATRQYGRWLRDNYADLEHKEVWQSFVIMAVILLVFVIYALEPQATFYKYITQLNGIILVCYLLWRVETLSDLCITDRPTAEEPGQVDHPLDQDSHLDPDGMDDNNLAQANYNKIASLLQRHCIDTQLYLQHDLTLLQLAKTIGTNRTYLSSYFVEEGITYNAYINDLRIHHFVRLYHEAVAARRSFTAQQLAYESGYRSYSTFSLAFKQRMGQTVSAWMRDAAV